MNTTGLIIETLYPEGFNGCKFVLAGPRGMYLDDPELPTVVVGTSYPRRLSEFAGSISLDAKIIEAPGSVEAMVDLEYADMIFDITETGTSLIDNGLVTYKNAGGLALQGVRNDSYSL